MPTLALQDGRIHKDEFALALFKAQQRSNLFTDRVFEVFDTKKNDVIDFGEFVRALSVFHPKAPLEEKAACALSLPAVQFSVCVLHWQYVYTFSSHSWLGRGSALVRCLSGSFLHTRYDNSPKRGSPASLKIALCSQLRGSCAVAFRIYDLDNTGSINQGEVQRLLAALLADNPALDLDEAAIHKIVQQVHCVFSIWSRAWHCVLHHGRVAVWFKLSS